MELDPISQRPSSRLPGFYDLTVEARIRLLESSCQLQASERESLLHFGPLASDLANLLIENAVGTYNLPLGIATNFQINGRDVLVPMAVEETSVLAAAGHGAKLARIGGGFTCTSTPPIMTGQIQVFLPPSIPYEAILQEKKAELLAYANRGQDRLLQRGGGAQDLTWRYIHEIQSLILHLDIHTADAMGANIVNSMCEKVSKLLPRLLGAGDLGLRILTNFTDKRLAMATCRIPASAFSLASAGVEGEYVVDRIVEAWAFAWYDIYRATTHNKGVMNGIDPVVIATGNDWRAVEAGAHAWAARSGTYRPLTLWKKGADGSLEGELELPMAVGIVGGVTKLHPTSQIALKILGFPSANALGEIACAVGLAQNLSALRALATEGIQKGHMRLHQKNLTLLDQQHII